MEQPSSASYVSSPYSNMMDLPSAHTPFRPASNGPATPDSQQHSFDETAYFSPGPQELLHFPVPRVAEHSLDPWLLVDMSGTASPGSSRLSMSPSRGMATPPPDAYYSQSYPEQLQSPACQFLEQTQPVRSGLTSHPNWTSSGDNWERDYAESSMWSTQPFVAQPWMSTPYDGYAHSDTHASHAQLNQSPLPAFSFPAQGQFSVQVAVPTRVALNSAADDDNEDSDEESDSDDDASDYSQSSQTSVRRPRARAPGARVEGWCIPTGAIQQSSTRGYACQWPKCTTAFVRPEHLRRHIKSKHNPKKDYACVVPNCNTHFSRGDNLRDHYWTHLQRGGRNGKNKKYTLPELRIILSKEKKLLRRLREKLRQHQVKEQRKQQQRPNRSTYAERSKL